MPFHVEAVDADVGGLVVPVDLQVGAFEDVLEGINAFVDGKYSGASARRTVLYAGVFLDVSVGQVVFVVVKYRQIATRQLHKGTTPLVYLLIAQGQIKGHSECSYVHFLMIND